MGQSPSNFNQSAGYYHNLKFNPSTREFCFTYDKDGKEYEKILQTNPVPKIIIPFIEYIQGRNHRVFIDISTNVLYFGIASNFGMNYVRIPFDDESHVNVGDKISNLRLVFFSSTRSNLFYYEDMNVEKDATKIIPIIHITVLQNK
jgi:hypothetical protein